MNRRLTVMGFVLLSALALSTQAASAEEAAACPTSPTAPMEAVPAACSAQQQTGLETAGGSTCAQARQALHGELVTAANCSSFCSQQFVDQACQVIQGGYSMSGYLRYTCALVIPD